MGFCFYCLQSVGSSYGLSDECYGWDQARGCGIMGPDDPIRIARKKALDAEEAKELRAEAKAIRKAAAKEAARLELQASRYKRNR